MNRTQIGVSLAWIAFGFVGGSIDVKTFGHFEETSGSQSRNRMPDIDRLPAAERKKLNKLGLIDLDPEEPYAKWTVHLQYHWTQTFPAHSTLHIRP